MKKVFLFVSAVLLGSVFLGGCEWLKENKVPVVADCTALGADWVAFQDVNVGFSFCYEKSWGAEFKVGSTVSRIGKRDSIDFPGYKSAIIGQYGPYITISTTDYQFTGDNDAGGGPMCWNADKTDLLLGACSSKEEKLNIAGVSVLKTTDVTIDPLAHEEYEAVHYEFDTAKFGGTEYNLDFSAFGSSKMDEKLKVDLEKMVKTLVL